MFEKIYNQILQYDSIVIFGHFAPDGDCYGSQVALKASLSLAFPHKNIYITGSGYNRFLIRLADMDEVSDEIIKQSLAFLVDGSDCSRMEDQRIYQAKAWIKIDHHVENGKFIEGPSVVNEKASSTCEMVADFLQECRLPIDSLTANALYLGILTDTANFQFVENYPKIFDLTKFLCENGADPRMIGRIINMTSEDAVIFKGYVYTHYEKTNSGLIYCVIDKDTLRNFNMSSDKALSLVNLLANVQGYLVWMFACENADGTCHVEVRSNGPAIQPICAKYGGGGHSHAAGLPLSSLDQNKIQEIIHDLDETIKEYRKQKYVKKVD